MPTNKKKRGSKTHKKGRTCKTPQDNAATPQPPPPQQQPSSWSEEEEQKRQLRKELVNNPERINAGRLFRAIPYLKELAEQVGKGEVAPEALCQHAMDKLLPELDTEKVHKDWASATYELVSKTIAPGYGQKIDKMRQELTIHMMSQHQARPHMIGKDRAAQVHEIMLFTFRNNQQKILQECFPDNEAGFSTHYQCIMDITQKEILDNFLKDLFSESLAKKVMEAADDIGNGLHENLTLCWQCLDQKSNFHCTLCKMAFYCSKDCQVKHWKTIHKHMCEDLKDFYSVFQKGMKAVDQAFTNQEAHIEKYGAKPSLNDYKIASACLFNDLFDDLQIASRSGQHRATGDKMPSMINFYWNLKHVIHDGFWMNPQTKREEIVVVPEHDATKCEEMESKMIEHALEYEMICQALLHDYSTGNPNNHVPQMDLFSSKFEHICRHNHNLYDGYPDYDSIKMTPEDWLSLYYHVYPPYRTDWQKERNNAKRMVHMHFRDKEKSAHYAECSKTQRNLEKTLTKSNERGEL